MQLLGQQSAALRNRKQILQDGQPTATSGVLDFEEHSLDAEEQGVGFSVLDLTSRTVRGIETALQRLEAGKFGTCSDCRCRISDARLRALPFAALCLACQQGTTSPRSQWPAGQPPVGKERLALTRIGSLGH